MAAKKTAKKTTESPTKVPAKTAAKKTATKVATKAATKAAAKKGAVSPASKPPRAAVAKPTTDAISRAAYLIYRRRVEHGLPGDSHNDWLEAERQLGVIR